MIAVAGDDPSLSSLSRSSPSVRPIRLFLDVATAAPRRRKQAILDVHSLVEPEIP
jgi:hypothetical protein